VAIFENLWTTYQQEYAPFEERQVDWEAQYAIYRPQVSPGISDDSLFGVLSSMLEVFDDGHISLTAPNREVYFSNRVRRERIGESLFQLDLVKSNYLESGFKQGDDDSFVYGKLRNSNAAYIYLDYVGDNFFELEEFLDAYPDVAGYVVDLRHNQGGDFTFAFASMGRFTDTERFVFRSKTKNGIGPDDFTPWQDWNLQPSGSFVNKPIAVLTDRFTISAGERAVMAFMTLPNCTVVGDTTNGAQGTMIGRELANGWFYTMVTQKVELFDGQSYEGIGLAPAQVVINTEASLADGIDMVLEAGIVVVD
jgi:hypothetical protein